MEKIERQEVLIEELTTRVTHEVFHGAPNIGDSKCSHSLVSIYHNLFHLIE